MALALGDLFRPKAFSSSHEPRSMALWVPKGPAALGSASPLRVSVQDSMDS